MATYNGEKYLKEQLDSILPQLKDSDELVISDDGSTDKTLDIIRNYQSSKIKLFLNDHHGVAKNFENALIHSSGDIIFFADQDDVWYPNKIKKMVHFLKEGNYDIAMCNCSLTDKNLKIIKKRHFDANWPIKKCVLANLIKNNWLGACIVFTSKVKKATLPFPKNIVAHDLWLCLFAQLHFRCGYLDEVLQLYRRHPNTVSFTGSKSSNSIYFRIKYRLYLLIQLIYRSFLYKLKILLIPHQKNAVE